MTGRARLPCESGLRLIWAGVCGGVCSHSRALHDTTLAQNAASPALTPTYPAAFAFISLPRSFLFLALLFSRPFFVHIAADGRLVYNPGLSTSQARAWSSSLHLPQTTL